MDAPHIEDTRTDHAGDVEEIRRVIADAEKAFNDNDAELLVEHVASNATTVGVTGALLAGRSTVLEASTNGNSTSTVDRPPMPPAPIPMPIR